MPRIEGCFSIITRISRNQICNMHLLSDVMELFV